MHIPVPSAIASPTGPGTCHIAPLGRGARHACLTDFLGSNPRFIDGLLPNSRAAITLLNRRIGKALVVGPSATTASRQLYSTVALAVDRGALYLHGHNMGASDTGLPGRGPDARRIALALQLYEPPTEQILANRSAIGWFYVLGVLEPVRRGFRPLSDLDISALPARLTPRSAAEWFASAVPDDVAKEIALLLRVVGRIRVRGRFVANPVFGGVGPIIGSDGDWIAGDTLVELKCTVAGVKREHVAQLICYYVFDQLLAHGRKSPYGFTNLALCLPRQGCTVIGTVDQWLRAFGAPDAATVVASVSEWCERYG